MKSRPTFFLSLILISGLIVAGSYPLNLKNNTPKKETSTSVYERLALASLGLKESVFQLALSGYTKLQRGGHLLKSSIVSICDFSQSSNQPRLYVIDLDRELVMFHTLVAHGKRSGEEFASQFGNTQQSHLSSLGFYRTGEIYNGRHGHSLRLEGLEKGFNDQALQRGIVVHGAEYVSEDFIRCNGRLGRSQGCPAIPSFLSEELVSFIQGGSCFFIYYPDSVYLRKSVLIYQE